MLQVISNLRQTVVCKSLQYGGKPKSIFNFNVVIFFIQSADIRFVVAEGMCKLLLSGRILSAKIYARLVLLWYNPAVEDDFKLRQCLGVFLPNFALASRYDIQIFSLQKSTRIGWGLFTYFQVMLPFCSEVLILFYFLHWWYKLSSWEYAKWFKKYFIKVIVTGIEVS